MFTITRDEFGYHSAEVFNSDGTKRLGCTFRYINRAVCEREAIALQRIYENTRSDDEMIDKLTAEIDRKDDEISVLKKTIDELREELREANRMLDKYHLSRLK